MPTDPKEPKAKADASDPVAYTYEGNGDFLLGVPARDLTAADVARLDIDTKAALEKSGVYKKAGK